MNNFMFIPPWFLQNGLLLLRLNFVAYFLESGDKIFVLFKFKTNADINYRAINLTPILGSIERLSPRFSCEKRWLRWMRLFMAGISVTALFSTRHPPGCCGYFRTPNTLPRCIRVVPAVTGDLNVEFFPNIVDILEERPLGPVLTIIVQSGAVPLTIDFFVSNTVRTPDGVNRPDIASDEVFCHKCS